MRVGYASVLLLVANPALAQEGEQKEEVEDPDGEGDPEAAEPDEGQGDEEEATLPEATVYRQGHTWTDVTPRAPGTESFVAVSSDPHTSGRVVAVDLTGGVWLSMTGGRNWTRVLDPVALSSRLDDGVDEEAVLLEAEATAGELFEDVEISEIENEDYDPVDAPDEEEFVDVEDIVVGGGGEVDLLTDMAFEGTTGARIGGAVWHHPHTPELILLARSDGTWRSTNGGRSWRLVAPMNTATCFEAAPWGLVLAGTSEGIQYSPDQGNTWIRVAGRLDEVRVRDLDYDAAAGLWYAATSEGLFTSTDGENWRQAGRWEADLRAIVHDPALPAGLWLATDNEVLRSDDGGDRIYAPARHPLPGTTTLVGTGARGQLLLGGADGVWESTDGGITWATVSRGLKGPLVAQMVLVDGQPLAATPYGLFLLLPGQPETVEEVRETEGETIPELGLMLDTSLSRPGMDPLAAGLFTSSTLVRRAVPELIVRGLVQRSDMLSEDSANGSNPASDLTRWQVTAELRWGVGRNPGGTNFEASAENAYFVVGDEVYGQGDTAALPAAAANVSSKSTVYRTEVATTVADLYFTRAELVIERDRLPADDLLAQVEHELLILETSALIDAYTDGAFSDSLTNGAD